MDLVSIIMPNYNKAPYIADAMASVLAQSYQHLELIVIDDGSTDDSVAIAESLSRADDRVTIICRRQQGGASAARNEGLAAASGRFIAFFDSDDLMHPNRIEKQLAFMADHGIDICFSAYNKIKPDGQHFGTVPIPAFDITYNRLLGNPCICFGSITMDRSRMADIPHFQHNLTSAEDYYFYLLLVEKGYRAAGIRQPLIDYRVNPRSLSRAGLRCLPGMLTIYRSLKGFPVWKSYFLVGCYIVHSIEKRVSARFSKKHAVSC